MSKSNSGGALPCAAAGAPRQTLRPAAGTPPRGECARPRMSNQKGETPAGQEIQKEGAKKILSFCPLFLEPVARLELEIC